MNSPAAYTIQLMNSRAYTLFNSIQTSNYSTPALCPRPPPAYTTRETSSDKDGQSVAGWRVAGMGQRLKPSSGILITRPTCRTDLGYQNRDHLEYVVGEVNAQAIGTMSERRT